MKLEATHGLQTSSHLGDQLGVDGKLSFIGVDLDGKLANLHLTQLMDHLTHKRMPVI